MTHPVLSTRSNALEGEQLKAPRRLSLREEQKQLTYDRLLDAALAVFRVSGYRAATIDQITTEAGANRATFYLHFKDKIGVAAGLARRLTAGHAQQFLALNKITDPTMNDVRAWLQNYIAIRSEDLVLGQMVTEALSSEPEFALEYLEYMGRIADRMTNALARWSGKRRQVTRSKIVLVEMMISRYLAHTVFQGLKFPGEYEVEALSEAIYAVLFSDGAIGVAPAKKVKTSKIKPRNA